MEIFNKLKSLNFQAFCFVNNDLKLISDEDDVEAYMNINNNFILKIINILYLLNQFII